MKRKISTLALAALTAVSLSSCGGSSSVPVSSMAPQDVEEKYSDRLDGSVNHLAKVSNAKDFIGVEASLKATSKVETYASDKVAATQTSESKLTLKANLDSVVLNTKLEDLGKATDRSTYYTEVKQVVTNSADSKQNVNAVMKTYYADGKETIVNGTDAKTETADAKIGVTLAPVFQGLKAVLNDTTTTAKQKLETIVASIMSIAQGGMSVAEVASSSTLTTQISEWVTTLMAYASEAKPSTEVEDAAVATVLEMVETFMKLDSGKLDALKKNSRTDILAVVKKAVAFVSSDLSKTIDLLAGSSGKKDAIKVQLNTTKLTTAIGTLLKSCEDQLVNIIIEAEKILEPNATVTKDSVKTFLAGVKETVGDALSNIGEVSASVFFNEKILSGFALKMEITIPMGEGVKMVTSSEITGDLELSDSAIKVPAYSAK